MTAKKKQADVLVRSGIKEWLDCNGWDDLKGKNGECYYEESTILDILEKLAKKLVCPNCDVHR